MRGVPATAARTPLYILVHAVDVSGMSIDAAYGILQAAYAAAYVVLHLIDEGVEHTVVLGALSSEGHRGVGQPRAYWS